MQTIVATKSKQDNLCNYCQNNIATCQTHIEFGDGIGNDNVIECDGFVVKQFHNSFPIYVKYRGSLNTKK